MVVTYGGEDSVESIGSLDEYHVLEKTGEECAAKSAFLRAPA